jgi:hypothetical protein
VASAILVTVGHLDVIIPWGGTRLVWFENPHLQGDPTVMAACKMHRIDEEGAHNLEVGNIDHDGRLDVVVRHGRTRVFWACGCDCRLKTRQQAEDRVGG